MRNRARGTCVLALVGLVLLALAAAQDGGPTRGLSIGGIVRDDETQQPITAVALELHGNSSENAVHPTVSGTRGEFQFNSVGSGDFHIIAHAHGYEPASIPVMLGGVPIFNMTVPMHRIGSEHAAPPTDPVSLHELNIPDKARDAFDKGMKQLMGAKPDYRRALASFERAIREYSDYYEAYAEMGVAYAHLGDRAAAELSLRKSVQMSASRYPDALFLLSEMLNDAGQFIDAEGFSRQCATQDESSWSCELELARALAGLKHPAEAEAIANKASALNPNNAKTYLVLGNIHIQERKYEAVVKDFDAYLKLDPSGPMSDQVRVAQTQARKALASTPQANSRPQ